MLTALADLPGLLADLPLPDPAAMAAAGARQQQLTKPLGALGRLEELAIFLAGWQGRAVPRLDRPRIAIFVGWHGIAQKGLSAYPAAVTGQMLANFRAGGAAINQLAAAAGADLEVVAVQEGRPTRPFDEAPAMEEAVLAACLATGFQAVRAETDLLVIGEMGIGNTASAAALCALLLGGSGRDWAGPGTGLDAAGVARKAAAIDAALARAGAAARSPWAALKEVGGHEIAAMAGAILAARRRRIPVLLDGFVATAAAAVLEVARPGALAHCQAGHRSGEPAHGRLLDRLGLVPLLDLGLRLGEGSGAALALPILRAAVAVHAGMATFASAGISRQDEPC